MPESTDAKHRAAVPPQALDCQRVGIAEVSGPDPRIPQRPTIVCMKWGTQYGPEYVNRLYGMAARRTKRPFRLVCLTDDETGLRPEVERHPIPTIPLPQKGYRQSWRKLAMFSPEIARVLGDEVLFLDLDIIIVDRLDGFFDHPGDFLIIRDWYHPFSRIGNSSVCRFRPSRSIDVFEEYCRDYKLIAKRFRNEREYLSWYLGYFGALEFWPQGWCASFKRDCIPRWPWNHWRTPRVPSGSRIVVFHGYPKPSDACNGSTAKKRRCTHLPASWVCEHWRE